MGGRAGGGAGFGSRAGGGLQRTLASVESSIRHLPYENSAIIDEKGNIIEQVSGERGRVGYDGIRAENNYVTHNHPGEDSASLSRKDIMNAIESNVKEVRAVTGRYTYSMKPSGKGWGVTQYEIKGSEKFNFGKTVHTYGHKPGSKNPDASFRKIQDAYRIASKNISGRLDKYVANSSNKTTARARANALKWHLINKEFAKMTGFKYTKTKVK